MSILLVVMLACASADLRDAGELYAAEEGLKSVPPTKNGAPLDLRVGFYVESLGTIRASEMAFDMDMYFRLNWKDERLRHDGDDLRTLSKENAGNIWYPDLFFANAKTAAYQSVTMANSAVYVHPSGDIAYSARILLNLACNLDLVQYPLDEQECHVKIMSYAMPSNRLNVSWFSTRPLSRNPAIDLPEFSLVDVKADYCDGAFDYAVTERQNQIGNFSCLLAKLYLKRSLGYHIVQTYIPTGLIVIISWVSFWIDAAAVPARISLSFTTLLTLATQGAGIRFAIPAVAYAKAIDFWFGMCMIFVFAALIEFAAVNSLMRSAKKLEELAKSMDADWAPDHTAHNLQSDGAASPLSQEATLSSESGPTPHLIDLGRRPSRWPKAMQNYGNFAAQSRHQAKKALRVDMACRYCFPSTFFLFNCVYWTYYTLT